MGMEVELARVLETLPGMVFTALPDGRIDFMNRVLVDFLGLTAAATAWPLADSASVSEILAGRWNSLLGGHEPFEIKLPITHTATGSRGLHLRCNPMVENDRVVKWYGVATEWSGPTHQPRSVGTKDHTQIILESIP